MREGKLTRQRQGMTLVEVLVAVGLAGVVLMAILSLMLFTSRSYAALVNYVDLDNHSRAALDVMITEIREADRLVYGSPTVMRFRFSNPANPSIQWDVDYVYNPNEKTLARIQGSDRRVLLEECQFMKFNFYQRNPTGHGFELYTTAPEPLVDPSICKGVQMHWICSRSIMQKAVNTESVQSARVVIRKK